MTELHLHLDGSVRASTIVKIAEEENISLYDKVKALMGDRCPEVEVWSEKKLMLLNDTLRYNEATNSLTEYLKCFDLPLAFMQTPNAIRYTCMKLGDDLIADGIDYAEIRFAPGLHTEKGYTQEEILLACIEARDYLSLLGVEVDFILCALRGAECKVNEQTLLLCEKFLGKGVVGFDLAGDESRYNNELYKDLFNYAVKKNIPFTIHAGEASGPESVWSAIELGAWRIGHGLAAVKDKELMKYLAAHNIPLEMCPVSNLQTGACKCIEEYPLMTFLDNGIICTINTDNRVVSNTSLKKEFKLITGIPGYTYDMSDRLKHYNRASCFMKLMKNRI